MKEKLIYKYFSDDDFLRISNKIKEMEKITAGEIRISIKENTPILKRKKDIQTLAFEEFHNLKMDESLELIDGHVHSNLAYCSENYRDHLSKQTEAMRCNGNAAENVKTLVYQVLSDIEKQ